MSFVLFNFETTSYCNAKCPSCFRTANLYIEDQYHGPIRHFKHLSVEDFEEFLLNNSKYLNSIKSSPGNKKYDLVVAKFCGEIGDPLMNPFLDKITSIAENVFDKVEIYTNGGLRSSEWIKKFLLSYKKTSFVFGIDGLNNEINRKYRVNVDTDKALTNMFEASKYRWTRWDYTIFEHNFHELPNVVELAKKYNLNLLCRFNGREFEKINDIDLKKCENFLKTNKINYYICK